VKTMRNRLRNSLILVSVLIFPLPSFASTPFPNTATAFDLRITVRVYNMANVSSGILAASEEEVAQIFREMGTTIEWLECPCSQDPTSSDLMLRIIPKLFASMKADFREDHLGFAPSTEDGGVLATIFFYRIEALTKGGPTAPLLANAIAHELGHLLLGSNAHSSTGIMRARWDHNLLKLMDRSSLKFTPEQAKLIRVRIAARTNQSGTSAHIRRAVERGD
jgi:hypothetical protein